MSENFEYCKYLYCWWPKSAFVNLVNAECVEEEKNKINEIMESWEKARKEFAKMMITEKGLGRSIQVTDISKEYTDKINAIANTDIFKSTFNQMPVEFKIVEIDKLAVLQNVVNLNYIEKLSKSFSKKPDFDELIDICLTGNKNLSEIAEFSAGNTLTYTSENSDLRFLGAVPRSTLIRPDILTKNIGGIPVKSTALVIGFGSSLVNVLSYGGRMLLNNGFHRVYALRQAGVTHIPVVVQKVINPALEMGSYSPALREYIMTAEKMPLLKEYFNDELTVVLKTKIKRKAVKISWQVDEFTVPV